MTLRVRLRRLPTSNPATDSLSARRPTRGPRNAPARIDRYSPEADLYATSDPSFLSHVYLTESYRTSPGGKIRVDNLHYDLTEDDLEVPPPFQFLLRCPAKTTTRTSSPALAPSQPFPFALTVPAAPQVLPL